MTAARTAVEIAVRLGTTAAKAEYLLRELKRGGLAEHRGETWTATVTALRRPESEHGTYRRYRHGCKCAACMGAMRAHGRARRERERGRA